MSGRGRGLDMTRPAWMTDGLAGNSSAPGAPQANGTPKTVPTVAANAPGAPLQQASGRWRMAANAAPQGVTGVPPPAVNQPTQVQQSTGLQDLRPMVPHQLPTRPPVGLPPGIRGRPLGAPGQGMPPPLQNVAATSLPLPLPQHVAGPRVGLPQRPINIMPRPVQVGGMPPMQNPGMPNPVALFQPPLQMPLQTGPSKSEWTTHVAPDGRKYFYNTLTKESKWEKPVELMTDAERQEAMSNWKEFTSPDGKKYYYNRVTKESKWSMPEELMKARNPQAPQSRPAVQVVKLQEASQQANTNGVSKSPALSPGMVEPPSMPQQKQRDGKSVFMELLASVGCGSDWTWEQAMRLIVNDGRYRALRSLAEKKACFAEYAEAKKSADREELLQREKLVRDAFIDLITNHPDVTPSTKFSRAKEILGEESRWKMMDERLRQVIYTEHMREKLDKENEQRRAERKTKMAAFRELLKSQNIKVTSQWRKVASKLEGHDEYEALDRNERLDVFQEFLKELWRLEDEQKAKEQQELRRKERKNREEFKELLLKHREQGIIHAKARWKEYSPMIAKEEAYIAVSKSKSGSRPRELFEDLIEEMEEVYDADRSLMKEVYRKSDIVVTLATSFEQFLEQMEAEDSRMRKCQKSNVKLIYDELYAKAKEKEAKEVKRRRKSKEEFLSALKHCKSVREDTPWEQVPRLLEGVEIREDMVSEFVEVFNEHIAKLKRKEEKRRKKESSPESSTDPQKHRSHKRHKRHHSQDSGEEELVHKKHHRSRRHHSESEDEDRRRKRHKKEKEKGKEKDRPRDKERDRKHKDKEHDRGRDHRDKRDRSRKESKPHHKESGDGHPGSDVQHESDQSMSHNIPKPVTPTPGKEPGSNEDGEMAQASLEDGEAPPAEDPSKRAGSQADMSDAEEGELN